MHRNITALAEATRIKALNDEGLVGGYLVRFGNAANKDLHGEFFTPDTNFELAWYEERPALYHHGLDGVIKTQVIGSIKKLTQDAEGIWAEAQLDLHT